MYGVHGKGVTTALQVAGKVRVQTKFEDGVERNEEWVRAGAKGETIILQSRRWRGSDGAKLVQKESDWQYEIGDDSSSIRHTNNSYGIVSSRDCPVFIAENEISHFVWKIKNCPWPEENFKVNVDSKAQEVVIRTLNKKYYKRFKVPALVRLNILLDESKLSFSLQGDCVMLKYRKPNEVMQAEEHERREVLKALSSVKNDGDIECKQS